jgi:Lsr2
MAKKVQVLLVDDIDKSSPADETVSFSLDGVSYEIDLTSDNAAKLRDDLAVWIGHAERTGGRRSTGRPAAKGSGSGSGRKDVGAVRTWARENGHQVSDRGRISAEIQAAYDKAHA